MFYPVYAGEFEQRAKYLAFTLTVKSATIITMPPIQRKGIPDWVFIITVVLFVGAVVFGVWAFSGRENYKNNVNQKINLAVAAARSQTQAADASKYAAESADPIDDDSTKTLPRFNSTARRPDRLAITNLCLVPLVA